MMFKIHFLDVGKNLKLLQCADTWQVEMWTVAQLQFHPRTQKVMAGFINIQIKESDENEHYVIVIVEGMALACNPTNNLLLETTCFKVLGMDSPKD